MDIQVTRLPNLFWHALCKAMVFLSLLLCVAVSKYVYAAWLADFHLTGSCLLASTQSLAVRFARPLKI